MIFIWWAFERTAHRIQQWWSCSVFHTAGGCSITDWGRFQQINHKADYSTPHRQNVINQSLQLCIERSRWPSAITSLKLCYTQTGLMVVFLGVPTNMHHFNTSCNGFKVQELELLNTSSTEVLKTATKSQDYLALKAKRDPWKKPLVFISLRLFSIVGPNHKLFKPMWILACCHC